MLHHVQPVNKHFYPENLPITFVKITFRLKNELIQKYKNLVLDESSMDLMIRFSKIDNYVETCNILHLPS